MTRNFLPRFRTEIERYGEKAEAVIAKKGAYELRYVPFEIVNRSARLVFVGITPGPNQISLSYAALSSAFKAGLPERKALELAKTAGAFGGSQMRDRMNLMMQRFRIHEAVGIAAPADVWGEGSNILHATSVVPHAAFKMGKMFNGSFSEILRVSLLRDSFELDFLTTLSELPSNALFIAIGRTPSDALAWCVENKHIGPGQILGAFAHPSGNAGSQIDYFIGRKGLHELNPRDPVVRRMKWLDRARTTLEKAVQHIVDKDRANSLSKNLLEMAQHVAQATSPGAQNSANPRRRKQSVSKADPELIRPVPLNPTRDAVRAALFAHAGLKPHLAQKEETKYIAAFSTKNGRALALDKASGGQQPIWVEARHLADDDLPEIRRDFYPSSRGRNSNLHKLPGFKNGDLIRLYPATVSEAMAIVCFLLKD